MQDTNTSLLTQHWLAKTIWLLPVLLLVLAALRPLAVPDEGRYADIGRWMLWSGDWLTARLDGIAFFHKPPLLYWLEALSFQVFGVTAWAARWVVAAHACLMLGLMALCVRHISDAHTAKRATWMLGSSLAFLIGGQYVNHDMMVATWMGVAIWCFARAFMHADEANNAVHAGWARAGFVACALGVLSKGLIGLLLPGLVLLVWIAWTHQWRKILRLPWVSGVLLFVIIALPWFVLAEREHPGMLDYMFGKHQFGRFNATTFNNARPAWFYLLAIVVLFFPWVFFAAIDGWQRLRHIRQAQLPAQSQHARWVALCWIWVIAILVFFSIPHSKLMGYALPVMPPLAVLAAWGWQSFWQQRRGGHVAFAVLVVLAVGLAVFANGVASRYTYKQSSSDVAHVLACAWREGDVLAVVGDYPYDLAFYAQLEQPFEVIQDWEQERQTAKDNWRRELFEGADFEPKAQQILMPLSRLQSLQQLPNAWLVAPAMPESQDATTAPGFERVHSGQAWTLFRSAAVDGAARASKGPEAAQHKGLRGCKHQGYKERQ
jgi:4-amino-4-deoxy-L-arabinose transferase-like glycosyltransferase